MPSSNISKNIASLSINPEEIGGVIRNLEVIKGRISVKAARIVAVIALDLLAKAQPRVPYDTKALRESGRARLILNGNSFINVGEGNGDGTITGDLSRISSVRLKNVRSVTAYVQYTRFNSKGEDIAVWTHEIIHPYGAEEHPRAIKPGTGPKYLETPFNENQSNYIKAIQEEFSGLANDLQSIARKRSTKGSGSFLVNNVELTNI